MLCKPGLTLSNRLLVQSLSASRCIDSCIECYTEASARADDQGGERRALHATCHSCIASRHVSLLHRIELLGLVAAIESERADPTVLRRVEQPAIYKERAF